MTGRFVLLTTVALLLACALTGIAGPHTQPATSLPQFKAAIRQYVQLHRRVERQLPPLGVASDAQQIVDASNGMAAALQTARAQAREGDIFTAAVAADLRTRISDALAAGGFLSGDLIASTLEDADEDAPLPVVNGRFPWGRGAAMWPCVLNALPPLPDELQYRLIGRDLVLVDTHADLVVDILRNAVR